MERICPLLFTPRLRLRPLTEDDAGSIASYMCPEVLKWLPGIPWPYETKDAIAYVRRSHEKFQNESGMDLGIELNDRIIGTISIDEMDLVHSRGRISILIGRKYWNQGFMTESMRSVLDYAFGEMGLGKMYTGVIKENAASFSVLMKLGFSLDGIHRMHYRIGEKFYDEHIVSILADEYLGTHGQQKKLN